MLKRILSVMLIVMLSLAFMACNMNTPTPGGNEGGDDNPSDTQKYDLWNPAENVGVYHAVMESSTAPDQDWFIDFPGNTITELGFISVGDNGNEYLIHALNVDCTFTEHDHYGINEVPDSYEYRPSGAFVYQRLDSGRVVKAGLDYDDDTESWTINEREAATDEPYRPGREWTEEEKAELMTADEFGLVLMEFEMRVNSLINGYMRLQKTDSGFTADLTYTDDVDGAPNSLMTQVKNSEWTKINSLTEMTDYLD